MDDLVERLRRGPVWGDGSPIGAAVGEINGAVMNEAADRIEKLEAENARLRGKLAMPSESGKTFKAGCIAP